MPPYSWGLWKKPPSNARSLSIPDLDHRQRDAAGLDPEFGSIGGPLFPKRPRLPQHQRHHCDGPDPVSMELDLGQNGLPALRQSVGKMVRLAHSRFTAFAILCSGSLHFNRVGLAGHPAADAIGLGPFRVHVRRGTEHQEIPAVPHRTFRSHFGDGPRPRNNGTAF